MKIDKILLVAIFFSSLLWVPSNLTWAEQGCCSTHGGVAGCADARLQCNDGTLSATCSCNEAATSTPQSGLAFLNPTAPETKSYNTPITEYGPASTVDTIPSIQEVKPDITPANQPKGSNTVDSRPAPEPLKPYTDEETSNKQSTTFKKPKASISGKEAATDVPSWAEGQRPRKTESGKEFAARLLDAKYGHGNYPKGPGSEFNKIKKWGDRGFE